ncbi:MAG TPA: DUF4010 domain-containing protein [Steroidobacteraceae bacterium]|nr:DUF4010 domain-containing protein [Steroidobacteraceae bacterium]
MVEELSLRALAVAFGIGLLIGIEREKSKGTGPQRAAAGVRTFTLAALLGAAGQLAAGTPGLLAAVGASLVLATVAYWRDPSEDRGITTEVAFVLTCVLGGLAQRWPIVAAGLGVLSALVLVARSRLHEFIQDKLTEREIGDGLLLAAAAVIVLPILPDHAIDPYGVLNPRVVWTLVVVVMLINAAGYVALRTLGPTRGLALSGFAGGFASSTATIGVMGARSKAEPALSHAATAGAVLSSIATIVQLAIVILVTNRKLLGPLWPALLGAGLAAAAYGIFYSIRAAKDSKAQQKASYGRPFEPRVALIFAAAVTAISLLAAVLAHQFGGAGAIAGIALAGFADSHSAAASAANLAMNETIPESMACIAVLLAFSTNQVSKGIVAWMTGGPQFAWRIIPGLSLMYLGLGIGAWAAGLLNF